jgi:DNA-binding MarR family transcriptional regulator
LNLLEKNRNIFATNMTAINPFKKTTPDTLAYSRLFLRDEELQIGLAALFEVTSALKLAGEQTRAKFGLTWAETKTLLSIAAKADSVMNLGIRLAVTKQALTKTLRNLENLGLVSRIDDKVDKRRKIMSLTTKGQKVERDVTEKMRIALARAYKQAGAESVIGFDQVLWSILGYNKK